MLRFIQSSNAMAVIVILLFTAPADAQTDLVAVSVATGGTTIDAQTLVLGGTVAVEIQNAGAAAAGAFDVLVFEDRDFDDAFGPLDLLLGTIPVAGLASGAVTTENIAVGGVLLFRGNRLWTFVDSGAAIAESDETNNLADSGAMCIYQPTPGPLTPVLEWSWTASTTFPTELNVMSTPGIVDLNGDDVPDVVFGATASTGGALVEVGHLRALDGASGVEIFTVTDVNQRVNTAASVAIGDIDQDGLPEIVACLFTGNQLIAFEHDGTLKWITAPLAAINWGAPAIADLNQDGSPEIVIGRQAIDATGTILWTGTAGTGSGGNVGAVNLVADIDLDGSPEVVAGNTAYSATGAIEWTQAAVADAYPAVANLDADAFAEIVVVGNGQVWCLEHTGAVKWGPVAIPGGGHGGPPTIADYDGDGAAEIGVAGAARYIVLEHDGSLKWSAVTQDSSSNRTGSSVFDFEGDGSAEVVYRDELFLRVYRGSDGFVLFQTPMSSCTWHEYVLVADVDNDGNAEIVAVANNNCGFGPQRGVYVFGASDDSWVPTRTLWNQYAYHITNVLDDGTIPAVEPSSWLTPAGAPYNSFRQNVLTGGLPAQAAPNLTASYLRYSCPAAPSVTARIGNGGAVLAPAGLSIAFYSGSVAAPNLIGTVATTLPILPGRFLDVALGLAALPPQGAVLVAAADDDGLQAGAVNECDETDNTHGLAAPPPCTTVATAAPYGVGWPGTLGVPTLSASAAPLLGTTILIDLVTSSPTDTVAIFLLGYAQLATPTAIGGTLLVDYQTFVTVGITPQLRQFPLVVPCDLVYCGLTIDMQVLVYDPGASHHYAFTNGLELVFGI